TIGPTWPCMAACPCWVMITSKTVRPRSWDGASARCWPNWALPIPTLSPASHDRAPSQDRPSRGHRAWRERHAPAFDQEPRSRQELLEVLRTAQRNEVLDLEALSIIEGALQVADMQVRDIMIPRSQMNPIKASQTPREFLPAIIEAAHSRFPVIGESIDD